MEIYFSLSHIFCTFAVTKLIMSRRWLHIICWLLSLAALSYLIYRLIIFDGYDSLWSVLSTAAATQWMAIVVALLLLPAQLIVESRKWQLMLRGLADISLLESWQQVLYGYVAAFITPYRLGEYPARLLRMGYSLNDWNGFIGGWRDWLIDWRKWIKVLGLHILRYIVWMLQLWAILAFSGITLTPLQALVAIPAYYIIITFAPSLPAAEVALKGGWAAIVFGAYTDNAPAILIAVTLVWIINTVLPTLIGLIYTKK